MKQRITSLLLFLVTICTGAWADDVKENVATIAFPNGETTSYTDIKSAIDALQSDALASSTVTFTLLSDQQISGWTVQSTQKVTFVGGSNTLHITSPLECEGALTVNSGTLRMDGFTNNDDNCGIRLYKATSYLTINDGTIDCSLSGRDAIYVNNADAHLKITGGIIYGDKNKISTNAVILSSAATNSNVQISGGKFASGFNTELYGCIFKVSTGTVSEILAPECCLGYDTAEGVSDGWDYAEANVSTFKYDNYYVSVISPVASTVVDSKKKVYKSFDNAWTAVNVEWTPAKLYILKSCTAKNQMHPLYNSNITLIGGDNILSYDGTGTRIYEEPYSMFHLDYASTTFTIASGHYVAYAGDCIGSSTTGVVNIEGGEFTTKDPNHHAIYCVVNTDIKMNIKGGIFHYSEDGKYYYGGYHGSTNWAKECIKSGYVLYSYDEATGAKTKILYANRPYVQDYRKALAVGVCDHSAIGENNKCLYCGMKITLDIASIGETTYNSLEAAFAAATEGQTIKMNYGYTLDTNTYIAVDKSITIDLNGCTIGGKRTKEGLMSGIFHVAAGKTLTICDTSEGQNGTITNSDSGVAVSLASNTTREGASIVNITSPGVAINVAANNNSGVYGTVGTLLINSGAVVAADTTFADNTKLSAPTVAALTFNEGTLTINGGTLTSTAAPLTATTGKLSVTAGTFYFDPTIYTVPTSSIATDETTWTVAANAVVAHVTVDGITTRYATVDAAVAAANAAESEATLTLYTNVENTAATQITNANGVVFEGGDYTWTVGNKIDVASGAKMTVNSGKFYCTAANGVTTFKLEGSLVMNGGTIESVNNSGLDISNANSALTITGGTIKSQAGLAICVGANISPSKMNLSGGIFIPASNKSAITIPTWAADYKYVRNLLVKGYDVFAYNTETATVGDVISANGKSLTAGQAVTVKPLTLFVYGNVNYIVTSDVTADEPTYTVSASGYNGTMATNCSITFPASATDPNNSNNTYSVTGIADYAFYGQSDLTAVTFPSSITKIGYRAFQDTKLTEVTIPENVTYIGQEAFQAFNIGATITTINYNAKELTSSGYSSITNPFFTFDGSRTVLAAINIGENVKSIPDYMFYNKTNTGLTVTSKAVTPPTLGSNTFGGNDGSATKDIATLKTPNATTNAQVAAYQQQWGFTHYDNGLTKLALTDDNSGLVLGTWPAGNITYTRTVSYVDGDNCYGSFAVPFPCSISAATNITKAYQPIGIALLNDDGETLNVYFKEVTEVEAGKPFLAQLTNGDVVLQSNAETTITGSETGSVISSDVFQKTGVGALVGQRSDISLNFGGTFVKKDKADGETLMTFRTDGGFGAQGVTYVSPFRAYIDMITSNNNAKGIVINAIFGDGTTTGISMIMSQDGSFSPVTGKIYDLNGRCLGTDVKVLPHGTYIINGRKVMK